MTSIDRRALPLVILAACGGGSGTPDARIASPDAAPKADAGPPLCATSHDLFTGASVDLTAPRSDPGRRIDAEGDVAVSPTTGTALTAYIVGTAQGSFIGTTAVRSDGTLVQGAIMPTQTIGTDPSIVYTPDGVAHLAYLVLTLAAVSGDEIDFHVFVSSSTDDGATWSTPVDASGGQCAAMSGGGCDKPWIVATPTSLYAAYMRFTDFPSTSYIFVVRSDDGGATWSTPIAVDSAPPGNRSIAEPSISVATDGTVHVAWMGSAGPGMVDIDWAQSTDGGATFSTPKRIDRAADQAVPFPPAVVADGSTIQLAYSGGPFDGSGRWNLYVASSSDAGTTWSYRIARHSACALFSSGVVGVAAGGRAAFLWVEQRTGMGEDVLSFCPDDATQPCTPPEIVNDAPFPFELCRNLPEWLGDYSGLAISGSTIWATWSDPRDGVSSHQRAIHGTLP
jgi:hypothetical protein